MLLTKGTPVMKKKTYKCTMVVFPSLFEAYLSISLKSIEVVSYTYAFMLVYIQRYLAVWNSKHSILSILAEYWLLLEYNAYTVTWVQMISCWTCVVLILYKEYPEVMQTNKLYNMYKGR